MEKTATTTLVIRSLGSRGMSRHHKIVCSALLFGVVLMGIMAKYLRRSRAKVVKTNTNKRTRNSATITIDPAILNYNSAPSAALVDESVGRSRASGSTCSVLSQSTLISNTVDPTEPLNCTQLGILGMETLQKSIYFWEQSLNLMRPTSSSLPEDDQEAPEQSTIKELEEILEVAYQLQRMSQNLYLDEGSLLYGDSDRMSHRLRSVSSMESFLSAEDFLSDDDEITLSLEGHNEPAVNVGGDAVFPLYEASMKLVEANAVPYRTLKTDMVNCKHGDNEYLAKLHCLRGAFSRIMSDNTKKTWITNSGKEVLVEIILKAEKDPYEFEKSFDEMIRWTQDASNWPLIETELKERGLRALTFFDIVIDYIFLDAFEDLEAPPASVLAVTQNRWLSDSFKETALGTAVWSVLKTKRKWLRYPDGFMSHFYDLSEHIMPTLAWGFLGPSSSLKELCFFFKEKFLEFLCVIFSFDRVRYTILDELASDVMNNLVHLHQEVADMLDKLKGSLEKE